MTGSIVGPMLFWALYAFLDSFLRELVGRQAVPVRRHDDHRLDPDRPDRVHARWACLLVLLMTFRPQGIFGNRKEMAFDGR